MSDLVERLKKPAPAFGMEYYDPTFDVRQEAAKRIAELENHIADAGKMVGAQAKEIAELRAALGSAANTLTVLNRLGGLGSDKHGWITKTLAEVEPLLKTAR